jgi:hypothetical protein
MIEDFRDLISDWFMGEDNSHIMYSKVVQWTQKSHNLLVLQENLMSLFDVDSKDDFDSKRIEKSSELMDMSAAVIIILNSEEKYRESQNIMEHLYEYYKDLVMVYEDEYTETEMEKEFLEIMNKKKSIIKSIEGWNIDEY